MCVHICVCMYLYTHIHSYFANMINSANNVPVSEWNNNKFANAPTLLFIMHFSCGQIFHRIMDAYSLTVLPILSKCDYPFDLKRCSE